MNKLLVIVVLWAACGYGAWGLTMGHFTHQYPYMPNTGISTFTAAFGPAGLFAALVCEQPYHWLVKPKATEERWQIYHETYPNFPRSRFERDYN